MTDFPVSLMQKTLHRSNGRNIIAIVSGLGGVGKTYIAVTMAGLLAQQGKKVLLFDGDLGLANVDSHLMMTTQPDIESVLMTKIPMNKGIRHFEQGSFDVLAGRSNKYSLGTINKGTQQVLKDDLLLLSTHYDTVILDLNSGIQSVCDLFLRVAGTILVVCTDDPTALTDGFTLIKKIDQTELAQRVQIVVNQAVSLKEGERAYYTLAKACNDFFKFEPPICGIVRYDKVVSEFMEKRVPLFNICPNCDSVSDIKEMMQNIKNI